MGGEGNYRDSRFQTRKSAGGLVEAGHWPFKQKL